MSWLQGSLIMGSEHCLSGQLNLRKAMYFFLAFLILRVNFLFELQAFDFAFIFHF